MALNSALVVRVSVLAVALASSSNAFAQPVNGTAADDISLPASAPLMPASTVSPEIGSAESELPTIPIRDWQLEGVLIPQQASWQMGRSMGAAPRIPRLPQPRVGKPRSGAYKSAQRILAGAAMGTIGFVIGTAAGALMGSAGCACEDGALYGMMIGAPVGVAAGATLGVLVAR